jgi:WD40 repeat protein
LHLDNAFPYVSAMKIRLLSPWRYLVALGMTTLSCGSDGASDEASLTSSPSATVESTTGQLANVGGQLMYSRFSEANHTFLSTHISNPDGSDEVELPLPGPEGGGRWSYAGNQIAVATILDDGRVGTAIIQPDGTVDRVLAIPDNSLNLPCIVWSPDDSRLACEGWDDGDESRRGIYVVDAADGGALLRLTTPPPGMADMPGDYSPDGEWLIFKRAKEEESGPLMIVPATGGKEPTQFAQGVFEDAGRFSPDGAFVATAFDGTIMILDVDGATVHEIANDYYLFGPDWSPSGNWIAYSGTAGGFRADIFVSHPDGSNTHQITNTPANEIGLDWGPGP